MMVEKGKVSDLLVRRGGPSPCHLSLPIDFLSKYCALMMVERGKVSDLFV